MNKGKGILIFNVAGFNLKLISALLEAEDCTVHVTSLPFEAIHILKTHDIDLILAPPKLEGMDGNEFKELAEKIKPGVSIFLLPLATPEAAPNNDASAECHVDLKEFVQFIQNHIRVENHLIDQLARFKEFIFSLTDRLLQFFEANDNYFFNNNHLVATLSCNIARRLHLDDKLIEAIHLAALLRDIGKIGIQQTLFKNRGKLNQDDLMVIKSHPLNTLQLLKQITFPWNIDSIIIHHHEHYDGKGYPDGLTGRNIPLGSRIIAAADAYVAMTTDRSYRPALSKEAAIHELMRMSGSQFDPEVVENLIAVLNYDHPVGSRKSLLVLYRDEALAAFLKLNMNTDDRQVVFSLCTDAELEHLQEKRFDLLVVEEDALNCCSPDFSAKIRQDSNTPTPLLLITNSIDLILFEDDPYTEWIPKPINVEKLHQKIRLLLGEAAFGEEHLRLPTEPRGVSGSLEEMGLTDIIQILNMGIKTARVTISGGKNKGEIFVKSGRIVSVCTRELKGHDAFFEMIGWEKGMFRIHHGKTSGEENVTMDTMTLLLEAARVLDEKKYNLAEAK